MFSLSIPLIDLANLAQAKLQPRRVRAALRLPCVEVPVLRLLRGRLKLQGLRILSLMWVRVTLVNLQFVEHVDAQLVLREHPADGFLENQFGSTIQTVLGRLGSQAGVARKPRVGLFRHLAAGEVNLFAVHNNDKVPRINVGSVLRRVLAHQNRGDFGSETSDDCVGCVYQPPLLFDLVWFCQKRFRTSHNSVP